MRQHEAHRSKPIQAVWDNSWMLSSDATSLAPHSEAAFNPYAEGAEGAVGVTFTFVVADRLREGINPMTGTPLSHMPKIQEMVEFENASGKQWMEKRHFNERDSFLGINVGVVLVLLRALHTMPVSVWCLVVMCLCVCASRSSRMHGSAPTIPIVRVFSSRAL